MSQRKQIPEFNADKRLHWPIIEAYKAKKISRAQAEAQLMDIGCVDWEIEGFLDNSWDFDG